jgi:predicted transcriptional regulator
VSIKACTPDELMTKGEIAKLAGVGPSAVSNWVNRDPNFPDPWFKRGKVELYRRVEVREYLNWKMPDLVNFLLDTDV